MGNNRAFDGPPKLPVRQLAILAACRFAEPLAYTSVFPYMPEMIKSFGVDETNVAKWVGITGAAFSLAQCITAIAWGRASDYFGRKPMVILALFSTMATSLIFGLSTSLPMAIAARAGSGACNGNVGIMRTMVAEMVPEKSLQPKAFSVLPLIWAVGSTVGPAFGGLFAKPTEKFPSLFGHNRFFTKFPFALPNLIAGVFFAIGLTVAIFFLKETLETKKKRRDCGLILGQKMLDCFKFRAKRSHTHSDVDDESTAALLSAVSTTSGSSMGEDVDWTPAEFKPVKHTQAPPGVKEVFTRQTSINLLAYTILALHSVAFDQLLPVFLNHSTQIPDERNTRLPFKFSGGFGLSSDRIGTLFMLFGICSGIVQFTVFPPTARRYGVLNCFKACSVTFPLVYFATPYTALIQTPLVQQAVMLGITIVKSFCIVFAFPCMMILLTNSASSLRVLGTLNGFATSLSALGRASGPAVSGVLFTWGVDQGYVITPWWTLAFISALGAIPVWQIKETDGFGSSSEGVINGNGGGDEEIESEEAQLPAIGDEDGELTARHRS
jgi:predicted MFS family arabinose efflux permease